MYFSYDILLCPTILSTEMASICIHNAFKITSCKSLSKNLLNHTNTFHNIGLSLFVGMPGRNYSSGGRFL